MVQGVTPLFIDTGAFFAWAYEQAERHDRARDVFDAIAAGNLPYRPLYTSRSVLSELTTLILRKVGHAEAVETLETIRASESFNILPVDKPAFNAACTEFAQYDDHQISFSTILVVSSPEAVISTISSRSIVTSEHSDSHSSLRTSEDSD